MKKLGHMHKLLIFLSLLFGCSKAKPEPDPLPSAMTIDQRFDEAQSRVQSGFLEGGWVVSHNADGSLEHQGDSLIWTGLWLGAATCASGDASEQALLGMITSSGGQLIRFDPLPEEYKGGREVSFDGAIGLYNGVSDRVKRCPGSKAAWHDAIQLHHDFVEANDGKLNASADSRVVPEFNYVLDRLLDSLSDGGDSHADRGRLDRLTVEAAGWVGVVNATHEAGFRAHLVLLTFQTLENVGEDVGKARDAVCAVSKGMDLKTLDQWCGRGDLVGWIDGFQFNVWEYRHQRAAWETPDGKGYQTPGIDILVAIRQAYTLEGGR